jgi:hypothetical protein
VVAVDGGVYLKYENWRKFLDEYLREAFGESSGGYLREKGLDGVQTRWSG